MLERRALNRALLARQLLLERSAEVGIAGAVERLVGLQAQAPLPPYVGLWSRLEGFDPHALGRMLEDRSVVRLTLMRGTVHLVTVDDALLLRPLVQVAIERGHKGAWGRRMHGAEGAAIEAAVREELEAADAPLTARELGARLLERGIGDDLDAIANATRAYAPLVQVPPRGVWGKGGQARYATLGAWTGRTLGAAPSIDALVLRYLAGFGPATVMDMQNWSGLTKLRDAFERLRPQLETFPGEDGRELFDLPAAPRPDPDVPAPPRFLGEFDNVLLGHADRSRVIPGDFPLEAIQQARRSVGSLLVDGVLRAVWWIDRPDKRSAVLRIQAHRPLAGADREGVEEEAERLVQLLAADAGEHHVSFSLPG